ncbi:MAG: DUF4097 family beta strand repeat-containing protein [Candidatus Neomarinimicrobiota bacterium]|nr:DUF4097 family beta strand repeat-containing protein [Candidatus Neomarinimicrobiota bacterium]
MNFRTHLLPFFLLLTPTAAQEIDQLAYNKYVVTSVQTLDATSPSELIIKDFRGDIWIKSGLSEAVTVVRKTYLTVKSKERAHHLLQKTKLAILAEASGEGVTTIVVKSSPERIRNLEDNLEITVPKIFSIAVDSRGGDLNLVSVQGEMDISTSGGDIDLRDLSGKITAHTDGGDIEGVQISGRVSVSASGGSIKFEDLNGELSGKTSGGDVRGEKIQGSVTLKTSGGEIELYDVVGREIYGQTSGGDVTARELVAQTTIDLHTDGGNIDLEDITGQLEASTSGGDIEIKNVRGGVKVWTSHGEIEAHLVRGAFDGRTSSGNITLSKIWDQQYEDHDIDVKTSAGNIELTLPSDFPADFGLRVISPGRDPSEAILSHFPLIISASRNASRGDGTVGDGRFDLRMEASMGTIKIKQEK